VYDVGVLWVHSQADGTSGRCPGARHPGCPLVGTFVDSRTATCVYGPGMREIYRQRIQLTPEQIAIVRPRAASIRALEKPLNVSGIQSARIGRLNRHGKDLPCLHDVDINEPVDNSTPGIAIIRGFPGADECTGVYYGRIGWIHDKGKDGVA